ncbi:hypothetical protein BDP27DRAFT_1339643 [Rhodocollybia butyracea]|uniref:Uncharacterized protein n=1 Tax=Rhodocollybia butyracea TaxID=206335 RepID=A0A9P5TZ57_9AGAR|nr:hypothetical protein BDP27DRAFT_1339643 [Rhodocollybia butyracea]
MPSKHSKLAFVIATLVALSAARGTLGLPKLPAGLPKPPGGLSILLGLIDISCIPIIDFHSISLYLALFFQMY